jgi:hypothetical protein
MKMKNYFVILMVGSALAIAFVIIKQKGTGAGFHPSVQQKKRLESPVKPPIRTPIIRDSLPVFVTEIPPGYRDWKLISVAHEKGNLNDLRAILGNEIAVKAYREGKLPFPDGAIIARLAWSYVPSEENNEVFGREQSFIAGPPTNGIQFMIKDSKKYADTGGWGFAQFNGGTLISKAVLRGCFPCHQAIESRDLVFTRYSP